MNGVDDMDRTIGRWLEAEAELVGPAGGAAQQVIEVTRRRRPRPAWLAGPGSLWIDDVDAGGRLGLRLLPRLGVSPRLLVPSLLLLAVILAGILVGASLLQRTPVPPHLGRLAYGLDGSIYLADWDGAHPVKVADGVLDPGGAGPGACGSYWGEGPMWSPDGRYFAYRFALDSSCPGASTVGQVLLSDPGGRVVASFPGAGWKVAWSPDATRVATWIGDPLFKNIGVYRVDGVRETVLTMPDSCPPHGDHDPKWAPDGQSVFVSPCVLPLDGSAAEPAKGPITGGGGELSPDGSRVAYDNGQLFLADPDGSHPTLLSDHAVGGFKWSPDGKRLAFSGPAPRQNELDVIDIATGQTITLVTSPAAGSLGVVRWSPDGDRVLYATDDSNGNGTGLWTVRLDGSDNRELVAGTDWGDWQWDRAQP